MGNKHFRDQQLAQRIQEELDLILAAAGNLSLTDLGVTEVSFLPGGCSYRAYVAPLAPEDFFLPHGELLDLLEQAEVFLRSELARALNLKRCPSLRISIDPAFLLARWGK